MNIGFIGGGTMAEAILGGMLDGGVAAAGDVMIGEPVPARRDYLAERYGVGVSDANAPVADASDLVVMAVKPQDLPKVYADIGGGFSDGQSIMSIVAGAKMKSLSDGMRHDWHHPRYAQHAGADWRGHDDVDVPALGERGAPGNYVSDAVHHRRRDLR